MTNEEPEEIRCEMVLEYESHERAKMVADSLAPDNEDYLEMEVDGDSIICKTASEDNMSLLHTLDDFLSCVSVAEKTFDE